MHLRSWLLNQKLLLWKQKGFIWANKCIRYTCSSRNVSACAMIVTICFAKEHDLVKWSHFPKCSLVSGLSQLNLFWNSFSFPVPFIQVLGALWHLFSIWDSVCQDASGISLKPGHWFRPRKAVCTFFKVRSALSSRVHTPRIDRNSLIWHTLIYLTWELRPLSQSVLIFMRSFFYYLD